MKARWIPEAIGATVLLLFPMMVLVITPGYLFVYHHRRPLTPVLNGLMLDLLGLAVTGVLALALLPRLPQLWRRIIAGYLTGLFLWVFAFDAIILLRDPIGGSPLPHHAAVALMVQTWWSRWNHRLVVALPLLIAAGAWLKQGLVRPIVRVTRLVLVAALVCAVWIVPELLYLDFRGHEANWAPASRAIAPATEKGRIIWILFDELSYKLALSEPPKGQDFPNLRRLHVESTSFGNIQPAGNFTDLIIPSVLAGRRVSEIRSTPGGGLLYLDAGQGEWVRYDAGKTLFEVAHDDGWNPGVVGWFIPYCRIFRGMLTRCFWDPGIVPELPFEPWARGNSAFSYALALPRAFIAHVYSRKQANEKRLREAIEDDTRLMEQARALIDDEGVRFAYIHLPVPHPPGIYDRRTHKMCACGNYLDNLTLADDSLGVLMEEIDRSRLAEQTTLIVSSDHSWRVPLWAASPFWTAEEERVSEGQFDARPVFMIHFAGQKSGSEVLAPVPELVEYDVIAGMLKGKVVGPEDVEALVGQPAEIARAQLGRY